MSLTGVDAIMRRLGSVKRAIDTGIFINAVIQWADVEFVPRARALAPVRTGALRDSITYEASAGQIFVFAAAPHASHVEFGTYKAQAQPFIRPAFYAARRRLSLYTRRALKEATR